MNKKIIILASILILVVVGVILFNITNQKDNISDIQKSTQENSKIISANKEKLEKVEKLKNLIKENRDVNIIENALEMLSNQLNCIEDKTCLQPADSRFFDASLDPANTVLRKNLEILNEMTLYQNEKLNEIDDELLIRVIKIEHSSSSFLAYNLLLRKGYEHFEKIFEVARNFQAQSALNFIRLFKNETLIDDENKLNKRDEMINFYLQKDPFFARQIIDELKKHNIQNDTAIVFSKLACEQAKKMNDGEAKKILLNDILLFSKAKNIQFYCQ